MLTKELVLFRARQGRVRPQFLGAATDALELAQRLVARMTDAAGEARGSLESDLAAQAAAHKKPRVAKGLVKLLLDRATFEEPDPAAQRARAASLAQAERIRRSLPADATFEDYEAALAGELDLALTRAQLYGDLPERRALVDFRSITADRLVARYDLALVQGLLLYAERLALTVPFEDRAAEVRSAAPATPEIRRVLRWMRFCRLVTDVRRSEDGWILTIEGPGAVIDGAKKYGLQLASFASVVPVLPRWGLRAEIRWPRRPPLQLELSQADGLQPGFEGGAGHVPPEMTAVLERWSDSDWRLEAHPPPRPVGIAGWCVPDFAAVRGSRSVAIELFHPWHRGALPRRLAGLVDRPTDELLVGVDRKLARRIDIDLAGPQTFEFSGFPTERGLKKALAAWWAAFEDADDREP